MQDDRIASQAAGKGTTWLRDLLISPLIVAIASGLVILVAAYLIPKLLERGKQLSYSVEGPTPILSNVSITVNGLPTAALYTYRVRLWNSGDPSLDNLPVRLVFKEGTRDFRFFAVTHATTPEFEFGDIKESGSDRISKRFVYASLNSGYQDIITLATNEGPKLSVFANMGGLHLKESAERRPPKQGFLLLSAIGAAAALVGSTLAEAVRIAAGWVAKRGK